jgi:hypothetical protein
MPGILPVCYPAYAATIHADNTDGSTEGCDAPTAVGVLGGPAFYLIMKVIEWGGDLFFLWLLILSVSFIFIYKYLYINFIGPMFNKYDRLDPDKYKDLINDINCLCKNDS